MPHSSLAIANEFLRRAREIDRSLTQMKLQKLVYIAHGWCLAFSKSPLIEDRIEAWEFGPVIRRLYDATSRYGRSPVSRFIKWGDDTPFRSDDGEEAFDQLSDPEQRIVDDIWEHYGDLEAFQLSDLTHQDGTSWAQVFEHGKNRVISDESIREHFAALADKDAV